MPFTTLTFIVFFAIVFFGYYALPHRFRWELLLAASWVFYGWMSPYYLIFLAFATIVTYFAAVGMDANYRREKEWISAHGKTVSRDEKKIYKTGMEGRRWWMSFGAIAALLSLLVVFKYLEFLLVNVAWLGGVVGIKWHPPALDLILPVGLSFYVFQSMAYVIDVQRGEMPAERNFFRHALYVSYFPQIMQGPIGNYGRLAHQLFEEHVFDYEQVVFGLQRVAWGFFKKLCVANLIADRIEPCWTNIDGYSGAVVWSVILFLYAVQLYADFSGYMDIACGCSRMLGVRLDENFNCPYFAQGVSEYWRRWHMSLSSWFRDYLFYPILRSGWNMRLRKAIRNKYLASTVPTVCALLVVWLATGLWHGASWGYVLWGLYYGFFMVLDVSLSPVRERFHCWFPTLAANRVYVLLRMFRTFGIVLIGYAIFKPADLSATGAIFCQLGSASMEGIPVLWHCLHRTFWPVVAGGFLMFVVDVVQYSQSKDAISLWLRKFPIAVRLSLYVSVVWLILFGGLYGEGLNHFEYFKF